MLVKYLTILESVTGFGIGIGRNFSLGISISFNNGIGTSLFMITLNRIQYHSDGIVMNPTQGWTASNNIIHKLLTSLLFFS